ncbi:cell cycle control protein 50C-like [Diceros bicornis minor]|uniref:cell cycle control protein 50C-like n=1 Tax=Diceros bicornis minor TaxID=77932 RepID=UPI0026ED5BB3|nr:cell cycle control protein 50C-like [Diceros bicornis minor]
MKTTPQGCQSRLPDNTALKQQQLPAYRLQLSATGVLSGFFATGVFCLGVGIILILSAKSIKEIEINYTKICANCAKLRENAVNFDKECTCSIPFHIPETMQVLAHSHLNKACTGHPVSCYNLSTHPPCTTDPCYLLEFQFFHSAHHLLTYCGNVYMYYKLYGFYQNLYGYILSRSNSQLLGTDVKDVGSCAPFRESHNGTPIAPCGAIANSIFNDTIILSYNLNSSIHIKVPMLRSGITWWTDKYVKFRNPSSNNLSSAFAGTTKPPYWPKPVYELDEEDPGNNGFINDDFIVWMRTAAFPTFKKLYRRLSRTQCFIEGLPAGNYSFNITYNFPVTRFRGEKSVVLSTLTWSGGRSLFLGLAYTVTGAVTWLATFSMMAAHLMLKERKMFFSQQ